MKKKSYSYWSVVMKNILNGKLMLNYVFGIKNKAEFDKVNDDKFAEMLRSWDMNKHAKITTSIINFVEHIIWVQLRKYEDAKKIWDHLNCCL